LLSSLKEEKLKTLYLRCDGICKDGEGRPQQLPLEVLEAIKNIKDLGQRLLIAEDRDGDGEKKNRIWSVHFPTFRPFSDTIIGLFSWRQSFTSGAGNSTRGFVSIVEQEMAVTSP
jgi:hypothetical protein